MPNEPRRKFIRHSARVPIKVGYVNECLHDQEYLSNVSLKDIAFESNCYWKPGAIIIINTLIRPPLKFKGKIVWCKHNKNNFEVGVELITEVDCTNEIDKCQIKIYKQMLTDIDINTDDIAFP